MSREIGLWRVDDQRPVAIPPTDIDLELKLEHLLEADPQLLDEPVMMIGRQVPTAQGKLIDLLAVDGDGQLHVLELKRGTTPREVVAQALDYGSWVATLSHSDVLRIFENYKPGVAFETAFTERFGASPPEELNQAHVLTVVAAEVDAATERIVDYLAAYGVPVNVAFFRYFEDAGHAYLARNWLVSDTKTLAGQGAAAARTRERWNGRDWYVAFGEQSGHRVWDDAHRYGFVSAGGGAWFTRTIRNLPVGARVFVHVPQHGYVGVGEVTGEAMAFPEAHVLVDGAPRPVQSLDLKGDYDHGSNAEDDLEYLVPVRWITTRERGAAVWETGMFANQNSACKLRNNFTLKRLTEAFGLDN